MATAEGDARLDVHRQRVDAVASDWRQGDVFRTDVLATPVVADLDSPLTPAALAAGDAPVDGDDRVKVVWHDDTEFVLVSQGCDIVEPSAGEPFIAVCPVITLDGQQTSAAAKGYMPGFAPVPSHGADQFADLGRVFTIEKSLLLNATRTARLRDPEEIRLFRGVVHRHFSRPAFPDELQTALKPLMERLRDKKGRQSPEGRAADAIFEIRVTGHPSWDAERIEVVVLLLCVRADFSAIVGDNEGATADGVWLEQKDRWTRLCEAGLASAGPRISSIELSVELLEEMTAAAYLDSDTLDLGGMSPQPY